MKVKGKLVDGREGGGRKDFTENDSNGGVRTNSLHVSRKGVH